MGESSISKPKITEQDDDEIEQEIRANVSKLNHCAQELNQIICKMVREERSEQDTKDLKSAIELLNRDRDAMFKKLNDFQIEYDPPDRDLEVSTNETEKLKCDYSKGDSIGESRSQVSSNVEGLDQKMKELMLENEINGFDSEVSSQFESLMLDDFKSNEKSKTSIATIGKICGEEEKDVERDFNLCRLMSRIGEFEEEFEVETAGIEVFNKQEKNVKKLNPLKMRKGFDPSDDHIKVGILNPSNGIEQNITGLNVKPEESNGFDYHSDLKDFGEFSGIEQIPIGLIDVNGEYTQQLTSLGVGIEGIDEEKQVGVVIKMLNLNLSESDQSKNITDLDRTKIQQPKRNISELRHEKENCAKRLKMEEQEEEDEEEENLNDKNRKFIQSDIKFESLKVILDQAVELEIEIAGLQVDLVCLTSEKEKATEKFREMNSGLDELKSGNLEKELDAVGLVRSKIFALMESSDRKMIDQIDPLIKSSSDRYMTNPNEKTVKQLELTDSEKTQLRNRFGDPENGNCGLKMINLDANGEFKRMNDVVTWEKKEEGGEEEKLNDKLRKIVQSDMKFDALEVISIKAAELEIDLTSLQVDLVCLMSEKEKAVIKFRESSSDLKELKWINLEKELEVVDLVRNKIIALESLLESLIDDTIGTDRARDKPFEE